MECNYGKESKSGGLKTNVVSLLYLLLRDKMPYGELSQLLRQLSVPITRDMSSYDMNEILLTLAEDLYKRYVEK